MKDKSYHDAAKEKLEESVLNQAIILSKTKKKMTRDILSYMAGQNVDRDKNDRPDIIRIIPGELTGGVEMLIGIEHFLVEQVSVGKKNKRVSVIQEKRGYIEKLFANKDDYDNPIDYRDIREKTANIIFDIAVHANNSGIPELKESFCVAFENHLSRVNDYYDNVKGIAKGKLYKLAFLIEIHSKTDDDFLNNGRTVTRKYNDLYPVFHWMVNELEKIDPDKIHYVVLFFRHSINDGVEDVIAIETKDIRGSLRKQGIIVYEYCDDPDRTRFNNLGITDTGLRYSIEMENKETYISDMEPILQQAYEYRKRSIPYVAPRGIQEFMYALSGRYNGYNLRQIIYTPETLTRFNQFVRKYPLKMENEDSGSD